MKFLIIFADMLRPNRFGLFNEKISSNNLDIKLINLGGTVFTNCFTPSPDTARSMAAFYSGLLPSENGCDTRAKWPSKFMKKNISTIFDPFIKEDYQMHFFSNPNEREGGLFPHNITSVGTHNDDFDLKNFLSKIDLSPDHLVFLSIPDYHWALQDLGYTFKAEKHALKEINKSFDIVFNEFHKDDFDYIFIFSDHGFKFRSQLKFEKWHDFLNRDRSNIFLFSRKKGDKDIEINKKLCSIQDIKHTVEDIFGMKNDFSLFNSIEKRDYLVIEDHLSIKGAQINRNLDIWAVMKKDEIYVRSLESGVLLQQEKIESEEILPAYDEILKRESQFDRYIEEYAKIFELNRLLLKQTKFMNGNFRHSLNKFRFILNKIEQFKDLLFFFVKKYFD